MARKSPLVVGVLVSLMLGRLDAANALYMEDRTANVGDTGVAVSIKLDNDTALYGFSLSIAVDTALVTIVGMDSTGTLSEGADFNDGDSDFSGGARITWGVVLDTTAPFDADNVIPVGTGHTIIKLKLDVETTEAASATIAFQDFAGTAQTAIAKNVLASTTGSSVVPTTANGTLTIEKSTTVPVFTRGNSNGDNQVDISDAVWHLGYLFLGDDPPPCMDASDSDDSGVLDITDAIYTLSFLFSGGSPPAEPFAVAPGPDPTPDLPVELGCNKSEI